MALPDLIRKVNVALGKEALQRLDDMLTTDEFNELQALFDCTTEETWSITKPKEPKDLRHVSSKK